MDPNYLRLYGAATLLLTPGLFADTFAKAQTHTQFLRALFLLAAIETVGFGLALLRKWAALYFSIALFWFGIRLVVSSTYGVMFPRNLLAMLFGFSLMLPLIVTIRIWKQLTWGRRFF